MQPFWPWKSNKYYTFWVCVCSHSYPACNAHAPYCHLWPTPLYNIFHHFLINGTIFERKKKLIEHKTCFSIFSITFVRNISHSTKNWARYDKKRTSVFMHSTGYLCQILMKLEFSGQFFEKYLNIKFHESPFDGTRAVPCRQTDGQTRRS
jgi:hypothetical protein